MIDKVINYFKTKGARKHGLAILVIGILIWLTFKGLPNTFFQQDEWWAFGLFNMREGLGGPGYLIKEVITTFGKVHYNPLAELGFYLQYKLFQMSFSGYAYFSLFTHFINAILVYIFISKLLRNRALAFLSSLLFAINSISHQAVTWVATSLNTQGSTMLVLLFLITLLTFLENEKKKRYLYLSFLFSIIALLFKENILPFLLFPFLFFLYSINRKAETFKKVLVIFVTFGLVYAIFRILLLLFAFQDVGGVNYTGIQTSAFQYVFRFFLLPMRIIAQSIFPSQSILFSSKILTILAYPNFVYADGSVNPYITETIGYDLICSIFTLFIFTASFFCYKFFKKNEFFTLSKGFIVSLLIVIGSAIPIIFISDSAGFVSLIEPRFFYSGMFGASTLIVLLLYGLSYMINRKHSLVITLLLLLPLIIAHILIIKSDLDILKKNSDIRKSILNEISSAYPVLPKSVVFYTKSNTPYYGLSEKEKILPVQVGFGWMLLVWYHKTEHFPACIYDTKVFLDLTAQGYKKCSGRGFGYFRDYNKFMETVRKEGISGKEIIAFEWDSNTQTFTDITRTIQSNLADK